MLVSLSEFKTMNNKPRPDTAPKVHDVVLRLVEGEERGKLLDMGAWEGALSLALKEKGFEVWACDKVPAFKLRDIPWRQWDFNSNDMPFEPAFFDYVVCVEVIEHLENPHRLIRAVRSLLREGGKLIISTPNIASIQSRIRFFLSGWFDFFEPGEEEHINPIPFWELERLLRGNGFVIEAIATNRLTILGEITRPLCWLLLKPRNRPLMEGNTLIIKARKETRVRENQ